MLPLLFAVALAQDEPPPLIDVLPPPPPARCEPTTNPAADWSVDLIDSDAADALEAHLFPASVDRDRKERLGTRTEGVVVVHRGEVVFERYAPGWDADKRHLAWSASKTVTAALVGHAVQLGVLDVTDSICDHYEPANTDQCAITVQDLLEQTSGIAWRETYEGVSPTASSVLAMLYGEGHADMAAFVASQPMAQPPNTQWYYSSGNSNLLSAVVGAVLVPQHGERYPWPALFTPLGMTPTFERDAAGTFIGSSYLWATPRDLARFGQFLLQDGCWSDADLLPEGFVTRLSTPNRVSAASDDPEMPSYGWQTWLNAPANDAAESRWPSAPASTFAAMGHWGQSVTVVPEHDLVVVRVADDRDRTYDHDTTLALAMALVEAR